MLFGPFSWSTIHPDNKWISVNKCFSSSPPCLLLSSQLAQLVGGFIYPQRPYVQQLFTGDIPPPPLSGGLARCAKNKRGNAPAPAMHDTTSERSSLELWLAHVTSAFSLSSSCKRRKKARRKRARWGHGTPPDPEVASIWLNSPLWGLQGTTLTETSERFQHQGRATQSGVYCDKGFARATLQGYIRHSRIMLLLDVSEIYACTGFLYVLKLIGLGSTAAARSDQTVVKTALGMALVARRVLR